MAKLRVYQLARELNRDNAEIIRELQHMGVPVTSHSNTVEDRLADRLRRELGVFASDGGENRAAAESDDIVAVDVPDEVEVTEVSEVAEPVAAEPEPPRVEAKAEPKPEPKVEEKAPEPKVAAPAQPAAPAPQPPPPPPAAEPPKVEQPV